MKKISGGNKKQRDWRLFFCFFVVAGGVLYFLLGFGSTDTSSLEKTVNSNVNLFLSAEENSSYFDEITFIHSNSILASSAPYFVDYQVLGTQGVSTERSGMVSYRVERGDTIESVANNFGITANTIRWANDIGKSLKEGEELLILPVSGVVYYVEQRDTIGTIAERHKATTNNIVSFNNLERKENDIPITPGQLLIIPGGNPPPTPIVRTASTSFINPVPGGVITQGIHFYNAIDIHKDCGSPVVASASGTVTEIGYGTWPAGNFVKINHGGVVILYAHLQDISVSRGSRVYQGQRIGTVGNTGHTIGSTGCHLHFDVLSRQIRNPLSYYRVGATVR